MLWLRYSIGGLCKSTRVVLHKGAMIRHVFHFNVLSSLLQYRDGQSLRLWSAAAIIYLLFLERRDVPTQQHAHQHQPACTCCCRPFQFARGGMSARGSAPRPRVHVMFLHRCTALKDIGTLYQIRSEEGTGPQTNDTTNNSRYYTTKTGEHDTHNAQIDLREPSPANLSTPPRKL